jgi:hypothetical protein
MGVSKNDFESCPTKDHFSSNFVEDFDLIFLILCLIGINLLQKRIICWITQWLVAAVKIWAHFDL